MQIRLTLSISEISEFYKTNLDENEIVLDKFNAERNIIENLDLQAFPITLKCSNIPLVQISILKVICLSLNFINVFSVIIIRIVLIFSDHRKNRDFRLESESTLSNSITSYYDICSKCEICSVRCMCKIDEIFFIRETGKPSIRKR